MTIKEIVLKTLSMPGATAPFSPLLRDRATIFVLHRFRDAEHEVEGVDPAALEQGLAYLRRHGYELVGLRELFHRLAGEGAPLKRAVAFTIDDGYLEQATIAAPVFARYDCPVTTFVATGFLDRKIWFWWDQIDHVFRSTFRGELSVELDDIELRYAWEDASGRGRAQEEFVQWCTQQSDRVKHDAVSAIAASAEVEVPSEPPTRYLPMSWDLVRECEKKGMSFAPHSVTHPILSRVDDEQSRREIIDSLLRLRDEVDRPVPVFCYPNGCWDDFGSREIAILEGLGFLGAVAVENGYADAHTIQRDVNERFKVPRFGYPYDHPHFIQIVSGVERLKQIIRRAA